MNSYTVENKLNIEYENALNNNNDFENCNQLYKIIKEHDKYKKELIATRFLNKSIESISQVNSAYRDKFKVENVEKMQKMKSKVIENIRKIKEKYVSKISKKKSFSYIKNIDQIPKAGKKFLKISLVDKSLAESMLENINIQTSNYNSELDIFKHKLPELSNNSETPINNINTSLTNKSNLDYFSVPQRKIKSGSRSYMSIINLKSNKQTIITSNSSLIKINSTPSKKVIVHESSIPIYKIKKKMIFCQDLSNSNKINKSINYNLSNNSSKNNSNIKNNTIMKNNNGAFDFITSNNTIGETISDENIIVDKSNKKIEELVENNEYLDFNEVITLKNKFFQGEKMTKGKIVEMLYGKKLPKINTINDSSSCLTSKYPDTGKEFFHDKFKEIYENNPIIIINLFQKINICDQTIKDFFCLSSIKINWDNNLEQFYKSIVSNKCYSNKVKYTYFFFESKFIKSNNEFFMKKHFVDKRTFDEKEIEKYYLIYEKIRVLYKNNSLNTSLLNDIYTRKLELINEIFKNRRKEFFQTKIAHYRNLTDENTKFNTSIIKIVEKNENDIRKFVLLNSINYNVLNESKVFSSHIPKNHNRIIQNLSPFKYKYKDMENIVLKQQLRAKDSYIKGLIQRYKLKLGPNFKFQILRSINKETKMIINYYAEKLQGSLRGTMLRIFISRMNKSMKIIQKSFRNYITLKKFIVQIIEKFDNTIDLKITKTLLEKIFRNYSMKYRFHFRQKEEKVILQFYRKYLRKDLICLPLHVGVAKIINTIQEVICGLLNNK